MRALAAIVLFGLVLLATSKDVVNLPVPMIHQRWDVPAWYDGSWGCGPTSTTMAIAFYKKLPAKQISCPKPEAHTNEFGWYIPNKYSLYGSTFDHEDNDAAGTQAWGAYGWCTKSGGAWGALCDDFVHRHQLKSNFVDANATWPMVQAALDRGNPVVLDTRLTSAGHIILARGYDTEGNIIFNDPYGDAHDPNTYGQKTNGEGVRYTWDFVKSQGRWFIEVIA